MIRTTSVTKSYGDTTALDGVDVDVPANTVFGLIGPNGSGKTTLVKILTTLVQPDRGRARVGACDVVDKPDAVRRLIGVTGQEQAVDLSSTGRQNLEFVAELSGMTRGDARRRARELLERFGLADVADDRATTFSGGMRRRLDLAASLVARPPVLFLDEPTTGLDPTSRRAVWDSIREQVDDGCTVFLTTQYLEEVDELCDHVAVLHHGRVAADGTPADLRARVGGKVLEARPADPGQLDRLSALLERHGLHPARAGTASAPKLRTPIDVDRLRIGQVIDAVVDASIDVDGIAVESPSLDEVFHLLTEPTPGGST